MIIFSSILFSGFLLYASASNSDFLQLTIGGRFCNSPSPCANFTNDKDDRKCHCDEKCNVYDECCMDSPLYNISTAMTMKNIYPFACIRTSEDPVYMKSRCPSLWTDENTRKLCQAFNDYDAWLTTDPLVSIHVTSLYGDKITYTNVYCARCNHDDLDLQYWNLLCLNNYTSTIIEPTDYLNNTIYDSTLHKWQVKVNDKDIECSRIYSVTPNKSIIEGYLKRCSPEVIRTCPPDSKFSDLCQVYTAIVYHGHIPYRNVHCALCNNVPLEKLSCKFKSL